MNKKPNYGYPITPVLILSSTLIIFYIILFFNIYLSDINPLILIFLIIVFFLTTLICIQYKTFFEEKRRKILIEMLNLANIKGPEHILDLGSGSGFLAIGFAKKIKNGKVIGIDKYGLKIDGLLNRIKYRIKINFFGNSINNAKLNAKIENVEKNCKFLSQDLTNPFDFSDNTFDIILSCQTLYCLPNKKRVAVFSEIDRTLKKNGKILFFESNSFHNWDIKIVSNYFKQKNYQIKILNFPEFKNSVILSGRK